MDAVRSFRTVLALAGPFLLLLPLKAARADVMFGDDRQVITAGSQNSFRTWHLKDNDTGEEHEVRQFSSRLSSTFSLSHDLDLVLYGSGGFSQDRAASVSQLDGLGDVKLKGFLHTLDRHLLLSLGFNLPTGQTNLKSGEIDAARAVAPTVLGFRMRNYGEGVGVDLGAAAGVDLRPGLTLGGGLSYLYHGEYDLDPSSRFRPGAEVALTGGADWQGDGWALSTDVLYRIFGTDQLNGSDSFDEGNQLEMSANLGLRGERWGLDVHLKDIVKAANKLVLEVPPATDTRVDNGNTFWLNLAPRYQPKPIFAVKALMDLVAANQSQEQNTSAWAMGLGVGTELRLTSISILETRIARLFGGTQNSSMDLSGWDGVVSVRWQY